MTQGDGAVPRPREERATTRPGPFVLTEQAPAFSAIVVSWNSAGFLDGCLRSLFAQRGVTLEVTVVDNGSTDGSAQLVKERHPRAQLIELGENRGFCAANNAGIAATRSPFVLFANSDIILEESFVEEALVAFEQDERIGAVGGKLLRFDGRTIDSAGQFLARSRRVVERGYGLPDGPGTSQAGYVFSICGAALLCRRAMIEDISVAGEFFDEAYFAFSEDIDVGWRARLAGWRAWYEPSAVGYHYRGGTESEPPETRAAGAQHERGQHDPSAALPAGSSARSPGAAARSSGTGPHSRGTRRLPAFLRRPAFLRYHILKNRWMTILKNDSAGAVARDFPFIAARDLALLVVCAATSPGVLLGLLRAPSLWRGALARRRRFFSTSGRWGQRRPGARAPWVGWKAPVPRDPDRG